jgi:hypothetical protein
MRWAVGCGATGAGDVGLIVRLVSVTMLKPRTTYSSIETIEKVALS